MADFISEYLSYTQHFESATSFWKWSAYATIAAVLKDNVWKEEKDDKLHPNIYVLLLADSAVARKDRPVAYVERLTNAVGNTKVISGRSSIQALLDELAGAETDPKTGRISTGGQGIFIAPELSAGIVQDPQSVDILTEIYKSRDIYKSRLRGTGSFRIKNLCLSMMAASNSSMVSGTYDTRAMGGGLLGRTMLVFPSEFRSGNSLWKEVDTGVEYDNLVKQLIEMAKLHGPLEFTKDAQQVYDDWYIPFRDSYKNKHDSSGIAGRIHTGVLKIAIIIAVARSVSLIVDKQHMEEAIEECLSLVPNYQQLTMTTSRVPIAQVHSLVMSDLFASPEHVLSRKKILQRNMMSFDAETLDKSITTLEQAGFIQCLMSYDGMSYSLTTAGASLFAPKNGTGD